MSTDAHLQPVDPDVAVKVVNEALKEPAPQYVEDRRTLKPTPVTSVRLPGGFERMPGVFDYDVEVRELTGEDEEVLAKTNSIGKALMTIINRATVKIGDEPATTEMIDHLLAGDREAVLLQIRKATYGSTEEFRITCRTCGEEQQVTVDLDKDVPIKELESPQDRYWTMQLRCGEAQLRLPTGSVQRKVANAGDGKTIAELNTVIIGECLTQIGDMPSLGVSTARSLGLADRSAVVKAIADRSPGPQLGEVVKKCENCSSDMPVGLNLALLFRL